MNERTINDLAVKSGLAEDMGRGYKFPDNYLDFAELIVQECLTQVDKVDAMLDDPKEKVGVSWVGLAIAKHWGLE